MTKETNWPLSKCSNTLTPQTSIKTRNKIDIPMLQALMPRFAQGPLTLDLDVYGSMILDVSLFLSFGSHKGGGNI